MDHLLENLNLSKLSQNETGHLNSLITMIEIKFIILKIPKKKPPSPHGFTEEFYQTFPECCTQFLPENRREHFPTYFMRPLLPDTKTRQRQHTQNNCRPTSPMNLNDT